ncbi:uncharacterized protein LOC102800569 [Saccoglossus kowalevskii]|uniref:Uncharacterized protein LOC102800569 n=1 Tax=Saccoglossus kowalevskii TaxID=10224 RepID=A0ABM0LXI8_SACKO|nr:PREDICTED: uncharacterized protein LOC102800569 [Saccoglossus kowalevskii]
MGAGNRGKGALGTRRDSRSRCHLHGHAYGGVNHTTARVPVIAHRDTEARTFTKVRRVELCVALILLFFGVSCLILGTMFVALYVDIRPMDSVGPIMLVVGAILFVLGTGVCCHVSSDRQLNRRSHSSYYYNRSPYRNYNHYNFSQYRPRFNSIPRSDWSELELRATTSASDSDQEIRFTGNTNRYMRRHSSQDSGQTVRLSVHAPLDQLPETDLDFSDEVGELDPESDLEETLRNITNNDEPPPTYEEVCGTRV